jgi:putative acetyltransferase
MLIRPEQPADIEAIHAVQAACFPTLLEANLVHALRQSGRLTASLVADVGGTIVGHVAFSPVTTAGGARGIGLGPVAVTEHHRRQGVAAQIIEKGLELCRASDYPWAVVLGEPAYYGRFGFRSAVEFGLSDEFGGGRYFQALELTPGGMPVGAGLVRYAPEFDAWTE